MPERTDNRLRLLVSCVEFKSRELTETERKECNTILARQKEAVDRSGSAFR